MPIPKPVAPRPIGQARPPERLRLDLKLARQVQESFLPEQLPQVPGYEFYAYYEPAQEVGGDYYDFIPLPPDQRRLAVVLGDVAGKGLSAALLMARLSAEARSCFLSLADPAVAIAVLNNLIYQYASRTDRFVTLAAAVLDATTHTLTFVNAGHPPPLIYRHATGNLEEATTEDASGLPLGVDQSFAYRSHQVELHPGDCVLLYSDGVTDQMDEQNVPIELTAIQRAFLEGICTRQALGNRIVEILKATRFGTGTGR